MTQKPDQLAMRREALLLKIGAQRQMLALQLQGIKQTTDVAELGYSCANGILHKLIQRPLLAATIGAVILIIKPARIASMSKTALKTWQIWQVIAPVIKRFKTDANHSA